MNTENLKLFIELIGKCPNCHDEGSLTLTHEVNRKQGLAHLFQGSCLSCDWKSDLNSSKQFKSNSVEGNRGNNGYDINWRTVVSFREMGKGHTAMFGEQQRR